MKPTITLEYDPATGTWRDTGPWVAGKTHTVYLRNIAGDWDTDAGFRLNIKPTAGYTGVPWVMLLSGAFAISATDGRLMTCEIDLAQSAIYTALANLESVSALMQLTTEDDEQYGCPIEITICNSVFRDGDLPPTPPTGWADGESVERLGASWIPVVYAKPADIETHRTDDVHVLPQPAATHAATHADGTDDIQDATNALKGLATAAQIATLEGTDAAGTARPAEEHGNEKHSGDGFEPIDATILREGDIINNRTSPSIIAPVAANQAMILDTLKARAAKAYAPKVIVSFIADDGHATDQTVLKPILDANGIPGCVAIVGNNYNGWTPAQLRAVQYEGWEISSHGYTHADLATLTAAQVEQEFIDARDQHEADGLRVRTLTYPYTTHNADVRRIARKYWSGAFEGQGHSVNYVNVPPLGQYNLNRVTVDGTRTVDDMKIAANEAIAAGQGWVVYYGHPQQWDAAKIADVDEFLGWLALQPVEFMTPSDALAVVGNQVDSGDFTEARFPERNVTDWTIIGADGRARGSLINRELRYDSTLHDSTEPITTWPAGTRSIQAFGTAAGTAAGYGGAGTLITERTSYRGIGGYQYQEWHPYNTSAYYQFRLWFSYSAWGGWQNYYRSNAVYNGLDSTDVLAPLAAPQGKALGDRATVLESASRTPYTITPADISGTLTATVDPANGPHQAVTAAAALTIAVVADSSTVQTAVMLDLADGGFTITLDATGVEWDDAIAMPSPVDGITTLMLHSPSGATDWQGWQLGTRAGS